MYTGELATAAQNGFTTLWNDMGSRNDLNGTEAVNKIQSGLHCCGNESPGDWAAAGRPIPPSCCLEASSSCNASSNNLFSDGCGAVLYELVSASGLLIAWIAIIFGAFEVTIR